MRLSFFIFLHIAFVLLFSACNGQSSQAGTSAPKTEIQKPTLTNPFPYDLLNPDTLYVLPPELYEVSGLGFHETGKLNMIQDEKGVLFIFDLFTGQLDAKMRFGKDGDYEGVERVGDKVYTIQSDGDVFEIKNYQSEEISKHKFETQLSKFNDTEGLAYDPQGNQLLLVCKEAAGIDGKKIKGKRAVYAFDLKEDSLLSSPFLMIDRPLIKAYLESRLDSGQVWPKEKVTFNPSAIAIHPLTGEIYILASTGKMLISVNRKGEILKAFHLDPQIFKHPEGMCFSPEGTLYISNEGDAGKPNLLKFSYQ